jgi:soluble lytic murein transglycosylase
MAFHYPRLVAYLLLSVAAAHPGHSLAGEPLAAWMEGLSTAAQAQSDGDFASAEQAARSALTARPQAGAGARAALALGLALQAQGRFGEATATLGEAADRLDDHRLRWAAAAHRADALFYSGHPGAAAFLFAQVAQSVKDTTQGERARWREADALLAAGQLEGAAVAYRRLLTASPGHPAAPGARLSLAATCQAAGRLGEAEQLYRRLWLEIPSDPAASAAGEALDRMRAGGRPVPPFTSGERLDRAERLLATALPTAALAELELAAATGPLPPRAALLRALAFLQLGRPTEAAPLALRLASDPDAGIRAGAALVLARSAARAGQPDEATRWYRALASNRAEIPGLPAAQQRDASSEAAYLAAWTQYDAGRFAEAASLLDDYVRSNPRARRADDARWFKAWSLFRLGRSAEARVALASLERGPKRESALYWQARLAPDRTRAVGLYRTLVSEAPESWYGLLAAARLASLQEPPSRRPALGSDPELERPIPAEAQAALESAGALFSVGLREEALAELRAQLHAGHNRGRAAALAELAAFAGDAELPYRVARDRPPASIQAARWRHPLAYPALVQQSAASAGVDPFLVLAVMLRESAFREDARSNAGAEGLLQLLPRTADRLAALIGLPEEGAGPLTDARVATNLGAHYLGLLAARFGDPALTVAAYNAGPRAAAAWATERAGLPLDEWVEDIPYRETRQYVKVVVAEYALYRRLYGGAAEPSIDPARKVEPPREGIAF